MTGHINPRGFQSPFCACIFFCISWIKTFWTWTWTWKRIKNCSCKIAPISPWVLSFDVIDVSQFRTITTKRHETCYRISSLSLTTVLFQRYTHVLSYIPDYEAKCNSLKEELISRTSKHSRLIPMYNARFILWPPSLSSPIRKKLLNGQTPEMKSQPLEQSSCLETQSQLEQSIARKREIRCEKFQNLTNVFR